MSRETNINTVDGLALYQTIQRAADGFYWTGSVFEAYNASHWPIYAFALTKVVLVANVEAEYYANFPSVAAGLYRINVYAQVGGSPANTDGPPRYQGDLEWNGSAELNFVNLSTTINIQDANT